MRLRHTQFAKAKQKMKINITKLNERTVVFKGQSRWPLLDKTGKLFKLELSSRSKLDEWTVV